MSLDIILLILRLAAAGVLLMIVGAVGWIVWRDYQVTAQMVAHSQRQRGRLRVVSSDEGDATHADDLIPEETTEMTGEALGAATLVGASFPLLPLTTIGRGPTNTVVINEPFCSTEHALLTWRGGQWWLEDRASSNGTRLNGDLVREPVVVSAGDVIGIGRVALKIELV